MISGCGVRMSAFWLSSSIALLTNGLTCEAQCVVEDQRILSPDPQSGALFGSSVSIGGGGSVLLVGEVGRDVFDGAAVFFELGELGWIPASVRLNFANPGERTHFGGAVAVSESGDRAMIGAPKDSGGVGAVYALRRTGAGWEYDGTKVAPVGGLANGQFGASVDLSANGSVAVVGANEDNGTWGAAYVLERIGDSWSQTAKLAGPMEAAFAGQGVSISGDGRVIAVGAPGENGGVGAVRVYEKVDGIWVLRQGPISAVDSTGAGRFGTSVALSMEGDMLMVGAPSDSADTGAVHAFKLVEGSFQTVAPKLTPPDTLIGNRLFGTAVSVSDDGLTAVIGSYRDGDGAGSGYLVVATDAGWVFRGGRIEPSMAASSSEFGRAIGLSAGGDVAVFGAASDEDARGAVHAVQLAVPGAEVESPVNFTVCPTGAAGFGAAWTGEGLTLRWQVRGLGGTLPVEWVDVRNGDNFTSAGFVLHANNATATPLVVDPASGRWSREGGLEFRCVATSACGSTASIPARIIVCDADFNCDGFVDFFDYDAFVLAYEMGDPGADINGDGFLDFFDYDELVGVFETGC